MLLRGIFFQRGHLYFRLCSKCGPGSRTTSSRILWFWTPLRTWSNPCVTTLRHSHQTWRSSITLSCFFDGFRLQRNRFVNLPTEYFASGRTHGFLSSAPKRFLQWSKFTTQKTVLLRNEQNAMFGGETDLSFVWSYSFLTHALSNTR